MESWSGICVWSNLWLINAYSLPNRICALTISYTHSDVTTLWIRIIMTAEIIIMAPHVTSKEDL